MVDLRTDFEKKREERQNRICDLYSQLHELHEAQPELAPHRIMTAVAKSQAMTTQGVRDILIRRGLYTPASAN